MNYNEFFQRENIIETILNFLITFDNEKHSSSIKRGLYLYGKHGIGKTSFICDFLRDHHYQIIHYNSCDTFNKDFIYNMSTECMNDTCILSSFTKKPKKKVIVIDDIVSIHVSDRTAIGKLIKLLRPKKTKRQKSEEIAMVPIICVNHYYLDKKIKELMKVCECVEMPPPTTNQLINYTKQYVSLKNQNTLSENIISLYVDKSNKNLNRLHNIIHYHLEHDDIYEGNTNLNTKQHLKDYNYVNIKDVVKIMFQKPLQLEDHFIVLNETDRTSISMLIHENIIDHLEHKLNTTNHNSVAYTSSSSSVDQSINETDLKVFENYGEILNDICYYDYIDRVTFQKQIWILNELNSINKNVRNLNKYKEYVRESKKNDLCKEPRFTKVLTKYSTEYNNHIFITEIAQKLQLDTKDVICHFIYYRNNGIEINHEEFHKYEITSLDVNRMIRYVNALYE